MASVEVNSVTLVLSSHHVGSEDGIQVLRLGSKCSHSLNHLASPRVIILQYNHTTMINTGQKMECEMGSF